MRADRRAKRADSGGFWEPILGQNTGNLRNIKVLAREARRFLEASSTNFAEGGRGYGAM